MPDIQTSRCDPDRGVGLEGGLAPLLNFFLKSLQTSVIHFRSHTHTHTQKPHARGRGSCSALWQWQRRMCDRGRSYRSWQHFSSAWNEEMDRQTKRQKEDTCLELDRCQNLKGNRTVGRIWATDKLKLTDTKAFKKMSTFSRLFVLNCIWLLAQLQHVKSTFILIFSFLFEIVLTHFCSGSSKITRNKLSDSDVKIKTAYPAGIRWSRERKKLILWFL